MVSFGPALHVAMKKHFIKRKRQLPPAAGNKAMSV